MLSCCDVGAELQVLRAVVSRVLHSHTRMTSTGAAGPRRVVCTVVVPESQAKLFYSLRVTFVRE